MNNNYIGKIGNYLLKGMVYAAEGMTIVYDVAIKGKTLDEIAEENPHFSIAQIKSDKKGDASLESIK